MATGTKGREIKSKGSIQKMRQLERDLSSRRENLRRMEGGRNCGRGKYIKLKG